MANYELEKKNIFKPVEYYEGIAKEFRCQGNVIRLFETLLDLNHIYAEFYPDKSLVIKEEISNLLEKYDIPIRIKKRYYHSIGREYFFNSDYANARIFLKKVLSIECRINTCIFYLSCFSHLNEKEQEYIYFDFDENHRLFHYFEFFKLKFEEKSFQELEDYLMKEVLKQLKKDQYLEPWWNMFDYELSELTKKTRNYSKYQKFIELRKKTVKIS